MGGVRGLFPGPQKSLSPPTLGFRLPASKTEKGPVLVRSEQIVAQGDSFICGCFISAFHSVTCVPKTLSEQCPKHTILVSHCLAP